MRFPNGIENNQVPAPEANRDYKQTYKKFFLLLSLFHLSHIIHTDFADVQSHFHYFYSTKFLLFFYLFYPTFFYSFLFVLCIISVLANITKKLSFGNANRYVFFLFILFSLFLPSSIYIFIFPPLFTRMKGFYF